MHEKNPDGSRNQEFANLMLAGSTLTGAATGALTGGRPANIAAAASIASTATANNRLLHPQEIDWIGQNAKPFAEALSAQLGRPVGELEAMQWLTADGESDVDKAM